MAAAGFQRKKRLLVNAVSFKSEQVPFRAKTIDKCGEGRDWLNWPDGKGTIGSQFGQRSMSRIKILGGKSNERWVSSECREDARRASSDTRQGERESCLSRRMVMIASKGRRRASEGTRGLHQIINTYKRTIGREEGRLREAAVGGPRQQGPTSDSEGAGAEKKRGGKKGGERLGPGQVAAELGWMS